LANRGERESYFPLLLVGTAIYADTGLTWEGTYQKNITSGGAWDMKLWLGDWAKADLLHFINETMESTGVILNPIRLSLNREDVERFRRPNGFDGDDGKVFPWCYETRELPAFDNDVTMPLYENTVHASQVKSGSVVVVEARVHIRDDKGKKSLVFGLQKIWLLR
jgi:hypothetical protein